jgi:tRNA nucleotidyltransferase/poly(A) polymerase
MKIFEVGGCVRDEIMGVPSKDIDFSVVMEDSDFPGPGTVVHVPDAFSQMEAILTNRGFKIFLSTPQFFTVRAQFPKSSSRGNLTADFVLARKESEYTDGRRPDTVEIGTLEDDLARRDFTMNAIAKDANGTYIDPFNGQHDIAARIIRAVGDPNERLSEDALRAVRALRFSVTKNMTISPDLRFAMETFRVLDAIKAKISDERIREELSKMFRFNTFDSIIMLNKFPLLTDAMFSGSVSLDATMKTKGRG